ncbi:MAG TPA: phosphoenolpyruvate-utilizing N-terminal domain-containing protein, partial [Luteimonas sp.]|nr:phosphoenolpyruvate-utilizing N-terminal domain-containing protein [Luteimonas sp.]
MRHAIPGHGASRGNALGRARVRLPHALEVAEEHIPASKAESELQRLHTAIDAVRVEMRNM